VAVTGDVGAPPGGPTLPGDPITDQIMLWYNPGGDIADLRRARDACVGLAKFISACRPGLRSAHELARGGWAGTAAESFSADMAQVDAWLGRHETACHNVAETLDKHATTKEDQLREARMNFAHLIVDGILTAATMGTWAGRRAVVAAAEQASVSLVRVAAPVSKRAADQLTSDP